MATIFKIRRDTASNWSSENPTLSAGEMGLDQTNNFIKMGDGSTAWNSLAQFTQNIENVEDLVGAMVTSNTETFISVSYDDSDGTLDFTVPVLDEDDLSSNSATDLATQQSIKAYVDAQVTAQDLDFIADSGGALSIDLDSETLSILGGTGIDSVGSGNGVTMNIDSTVTTLTGSQTLTSKTLTSPVINTGVSGSAIVDEDNMVSDSATKIPTQQSVKAYVDAQVTAQDLDFQGDTGGALAIDLDSESLTIAGGTGIATVGSGNTVTASIDATVATLADTQTLTNKTIDVDNNTISNIEVDNLKAGVLDTDLSTAAVTDTTLPSAKAVKAYVDSQVTAQDLDFQGDTGGALSIDLDSESITIAGGTGINTVGAGNTVTASIDATVATLTGSQTLTNKTLTAATLAGTTSFTGAATTTSTFDGRNISTDGTKLDTIETGATADQTDAEIRTAVEAATDSNVFTDTDHTRLNAMEDASTADQTAAQIKIAYESNANSNEFSDAEQTHLSNIETAATADQTAAEIRVLVDSATDSNVYADADVAKLGNIEPSADVTDATNVNAAGALMLTDTTTAGLGIVIDEDTMASDLATKVPTQQSVKAYVDAQVTLQDLDIAGDTGTGAIDLDSTTLTVSGTTNQITTAVSGSTLTIGLPDDVTIAGNLIVTGTQTTLSSTTIEVANPLLHLATNNNAADAVDIGVYGLYDTSGSQDLYGGIFRDASDSGKWKLFKDNQVEPTTTVNVSGTGYATGTLVADVEGDLTGSVTGAASLNLLKAGGAMTGAITTNSTFDGRAVATDGAKLDLIEASATADQTAAEIRTLVGSATNSNVYTDAAVTKLGNIETSATADQTDAEIRAAVEAATDSNVFTDTDHTRLNAMEDASTADQTGAQIKTAYEAEVSAFTDAQFTKLGNIETAATADQTDAEIRTAVEAATDSNVFTDTDHSRLNAMEDAATADQTAAQIKTLYEGEVSAFTDAQFTKLGNIETAATADQTSADIRGLVAIDEDDMVSDSAVKLPTQQSVKAYVDAQIGAENTLAEDNDVNITSAADGSMLLYDTGTSKWIDNVMSGDATLADTGVVTLSTVSSTTGSFGSATAIPVITTNAKGLVTSITTSSITTALTVGADSGTNDPVALATDVLEFTGGTGIDTTVTDNTITHAIDSTVTTLVGSQTLTNKTLGATAFTGAITTNSTFDTRDVATDGTKLDTIETSATADQTDAEIRTAVEAATDSNVFTDADHSKLDGIETAATADQTSADIRGLVAIDENNMASDSAVKLPTQQSVKAYVDAQTTSETAEGSNLYFTNERVDDRVSALILGGTNMTATYDDTAGTLTLDSAAAGGYDLSSNDTDDVDEGTSNLYHTTARARAAISLTDAGGDGSAAYNSTTGVITYTGPNAAETQAHISVTDSGGDGSLAYSAGVITYVGPSATEVRAHLSAGTGITYSGGAISIGQPVGTGDSVQFDDVVVSGDLTINGTTTTVASTNTTHTDALIEYGTGTTGTPANDAGIVIERGSAANAFIGFDESADKFTMGTGTFTGASTGNLSITTGTLVANIEGATADLTGDITVGGTVDGRDVAADGTKLDTIEDSATADQTAAEIRTLVGAATNSNVYTDAAVTKLGNIEASATADQTDAEIRTAVEAATDSNVFTDTDHTRLNAMEDAATADQTGAQIKTAYEAETSAFTDAQFTKLANIETAADVTDATNVNAAGALMLSDTTTAGLGIVVDEDDMSSDLATKVPTQQSVKAYVDAQVTAQDLDVTTDSGTIAIDLDSETLSVVGTASEIETSATGNVITLGLPSNVHVTGNISLGGTIDSRDLQIDGSKLDAIEASADVTDAANVEAAGAVMESGANASARVPSGTTAQRDASPSAGYFRWNTTTGGAEIYDGTEWGLVGGGNTTEKALWEHANTVSEDYEMTAGNNAVTAGPITINSGASVTVQSGSTWAII